MRLGDRYFLAGTDVCNTTGPVKWVAMDKIWGMMVYKSKDDLMKEIQDANRPLPPIPTTRDSNTQKDPGASAGAPPLLQGPNNK